VSVLEELTVAEFAECLRTLVIFVAVCPSVLQRVAACGSRICGEFSHTGASKEPC